MPFVYQRDKQLTSITGLCSGSYREVSFRSILAFLTYTDGQIPERNPAAVELHLNPGIVIVFRAKYLRASDNVRSICYHLSLYLAESSLDFEWMVALKDACYSLSAMGSKHFTFLHCQYA